MMDEIKSTFCNLIPSEREQTVMAFGTDPNVKFLRNGAGIITAMDGTLFVTPLDCNYYP
jgi:hypothetical protein